MQKRYRSIVMMPDGHAAPQKWFSRWCYVGGHYDFVSCEGESRDTLRDAAQRAMTEDLGLASRDVLVSNMAQLNLEYVEQQCHGPSHEIVAFYIVHLYRAAARAEVDQNADGRWLTAEELLEGTTSDGKPVNPRLTALLRQHELIRA